MIKYKKSIGLLALSLLFNLSLSGQTSEELNKKYGSPVNGIYKINEKISFSVKYGEDRKVCSATITKKYSFKDIKPIFRPYNKQQTAEKNENEDYNEFMKNFFPFSMYGKIIKDKGSRVGNCYTRYSIEYENILISSYDEVCLGDENFVSVSLLWKRDSCKKLREAEKSEIPAAF